MKFQSQTKRKIKEKQRAAKSALGKIQELFINSARENNEGKYAWGQFLENGGSKQTGIYGTSAAIQILTDPDNDKYSEHQTVSDGIAFLNENRESIQTITYKFLYLAKSVSLNRVCEKLQYYFTPEGGCADFYRENARNTNASIIATSTVLLSLDRYSEFKGSEECKRSLKRLLKEFNGPIEMQYIKDYGIKIIETSISILALVKYREELRRYGFDDLYCKAIELYKKIASEWIKYNGLFECSIVYSFSTEQHDDQGANIKHMFFLPNCLVALVLLRIDASEEFMPCITSVVTYYLRFFDDENPRGFRSKTTGMISTVDHLWIYRLFKEFSAKKPEEFLCPWPNIQKLIRHKTSYFIIAIIISLLSAFFGASLMGLDELVIYTVGAVILAISTTFLANFIFRKRNE
uniref:Uncharacterized protein n=1 Tax=Candidatus Kentrum sp. MB TaxID=2138164 RepID=A0A450XLL5_9GAMM|nr:MAG: hypothetical protein BECKMB1821I_GA0114274_101410 [Candidatus Kentron sp. MB]VFK75129.1 MAG: hypothetical protein BECKMB1821H_GA0114242_101610 [Candidatus Kentron sp. MB]